MQTQNLNDHDYQPSCAKDVSAKANIRIWIYFILMGILLFLLIWGLIIMFRFMVDDEQTNKIGLVKTKERTEYVYKMNSLITGKTGLFPDKKNVPVEDAMKIFLQNFRENSSR